MKNYGFVPPVKDSDPKAFIAGSGKIGNKLVLQPDGQWGNYLPVYEPQAENFETWSCTVFGTQNCIETLDRRIFNKTSNYSERFNASIYGLREPGADPHKIAESIRKVGLVDQVLCPMPETYDEYIKPVSCALLPKGQEWLKEYEFRHQWLWLFGNLTKKDKEKLIKDNLKHGPLGVSVTAWFENKGIYVDRGQPNNHWCMLYGFNNKGWLVFDSYDHGTKIISYNHDINYCKAFYLSKRVSSGNWFASLLSSIGSVFLGDKVECVEEPLPGFQKDLWHGIKHPDVIKLQKKLNESPDTQVAKFGPGSPGNETDYYGDRTAEAVAKYQRKHGIMPDSGYCGPKTRAHLNGLTKPKMTLIEAIIQVESGGNDYAVGDKHLTEAQGGFAYGPMQIRRPAVIDVNRYLSTNYKAEDCLGNRDLSIKIFNAYMEIYAKGQSDEFKARTWNGGSGWVQNPKLTDGYWAKVKRLLQ